MTLCLFTSDVAGGSLKTREAEARNPSRFDVMRGRPPNLRGRLLMLNVKMPPMEDLTDPLAVIRPLPDRHLHTIMLAHEWFGIFTHWWGGKTMRCTEKDCRACDSNVPRIWKGFIPVCDAYNSDVKRMLQFTPRCVATLVATEREETGILGMRCVWTRIGRNVNSPLSVCCLGWAPAPEVYTEARIAKIVSAIFRTPGVPEETGTHKEPPS